MIASKGVSCPANFVISAARPAKPGGVVFRVYDAEHSDACLGRSCHLRLRKRSKSARLFLEALVLQNVNMSNSWIIGEYSREMAKGQMAATGLTFGQLQVGSGSMGGSTSVMSG